MAQINKPTDYFNTVLWSGDSTSSRNITGVGFQPDWVWQKCRSHAVPHLIYDSVRTAGNDKELCSNDTAAEGGQSAETDGYMSAFISDGFTVAQGTGGTHYVNLSGRTYAAWNWLAGGTASSNTDGTITSSVSANTTSGFSIVSYTGTGANATVGHGLGVAPSMFIVKERSAAGSWVTWHKSLTDGNYFVILNETGAQQSNAGVWNSTVPTSSVFSLGTNGDVNGSSSTYIAYCFAEKKGFSKFGSYTGNGSSDGTFVYTGFRPAWVMFKETTDGAAGDNWFIYDNKRSEFNQTQKNLRANLNDAEADSSAVAIDILSNGFKLRTNDDSLNGSGDTYIYMAFAESPLVGTNNIPATAR